MSSLATAEATAAFAARHAGRFAGGFRELGRTGLQVCRVAFSACRLDEERDAHVAALKSAILGGVNLVETSASASDGGSERAVGRALSELSAQGVARREEIVLVTKAGYAQGRSLARAARREHEGRGFAGMATLEDGLAHCLDPAFLGDQLGRSCRRLGVEAVDVLLLQDPERNPGGTEADDRLRAAFAFLERQCDAGIIGRYGVSSQQPEVARYLAIAQDVAGPGHRLGVVGMPLNVLEREALPEAGRAGDAGIAVIAHRPLDARPGGRSVRLAEWPERAPGTTLEEAAAAVRALEDGFARDIAPALESPGAAELFRWGSELPGNAARFRDALHWRQVESEMLRPRLEHAIGHVGLHLVGRVRNDWFAWAPRYRDAMERLLGAVADRFRTDARREAQEVRTLLSDLPEEWRSRSLARQAIGSVLAAPGVTSVAVGMREEAWVADGLAALELAPPPGMPEGRIAPRMP